jgi:23S rRNA pseudouridine2605 synthase
MRLQKFLARAGAASRRGSEDLMTAGRVTVNGVVATTLGTRVDPLTDEVRLDGRLFKLGEAQVCLMLNKPSGYLTTMYDPQARLTVRELIPADEHPGLFPLGRLDNTTTGLLLFMTNGELAYQLLHPRHHVAKRYRALLNGVFTEAQAQRLREGIELYDGPTAPAQVRLGPVEPLAMTARQRFQAQSLSASSPSAHQLSALETMTVWITITEGRKRQVRRMFAELGHEVLALEREAFGPLELGALPSGEWRYLTDEELKALKDAAACSPPLAKV